ncbi:MAG: cytochrome c biogenesis protein/redoxin [Gemmatimonadota bacterium]|nr:cytochrome c biogenesis protein/redoxin [Gemmatimonadota bacterium]
MLLAFLGGVLAMFSPCVLPIVPFVFARTGRPFFRATVPMLAGLALTFAAIISLATVSAGWVARANDVGRIAALVLLALVGVSLLVPRIAEIGTRPMVALGARLDSWASRPRTSGAGDVLGNVVIGSAVGLLWAPCAGPILGLVVSTAALSGADVRVALLAISFAAGTVTALALVMMAGGKLLARLRTTLAAERWVRRGLGVLTLAGVLVIATGLDRSLYATGEILPTTRAEQLLVSALGGAKPGGTAIDIGLPVESVVKHVTLEDLGGLPDFAGGSAWINSAPLTPETLKGKVVLVWFWTFECYNCLNTLPHVKALDAKYRDKGLIVIGVHTPELPRERVEANVRNAVKRLGITYPVVIDDSYAIWNRWHNQYWPAAYYVDKSGRVRFHHFGEGSYEEQETVVKQLLAEQGVGG